MASIIGTGKQETIPEASEREPISAEETIQEKSLDDISELKYELQTETERVEVTPSEDVDESKIQLEDLKPYIDPEVS